MASLNKVTLIGNLGADPETRYMPSGDAVTNFTIATTEKWKDKQSGDTKEATEWHRIGAFGKLAEIAGQYLKKGASVYIEGSIKTRKWTDKEGIERYTTEIKADKLLMLGGKQDGGERSQGSAKPASQRQEQRAPAGGGFDEMDDDIPF